MATILIYDKDDINYGIHIGIKHKPFGIKIHTGTLDFPCSALWPYLYCGPKAPNHDSLNEGCCGELWVEGSNYPFDEWMVSINDWKAKCCLRLSEIACFFIQN